MTVNLRVSFATKQNKRLAIIVKVDTIENEGSSALTNHLTPSLQAALTFSPPKHP